MSDRQEAEGLKYGMTENAEAAEPLGLSRPRLGQRNPQPCPHPALAETTHGETTSVEPTLGAPMDIAEVAALLGCSAWTVRQRYMRLGLPCLRTSATGKLVFFRGQVIDWILQRQKLQKGGTSR